MSFKEGTLLYKINRPIATVLSLIAAWVLAAMMFLTFIDVFLRSVFNRPILGAGEVIQFMMAIVIPFSVVYCAYQFGHISVDFIVERFQEKTRKSLGLITRFLMVLLVAPMAWQTILYIKDEYDSHLTSPVLYIPVPPFIAIMAIGFICFFIVVLSQFILKLKEVVSAWTR